MRFIRTLFFSIGLFIASSSLAGEVAAVSARGPFDIYVPNIDSGFEIEGELLFLKPMADNLGWGVQTYFLPFITPNWSIKTIHPSYSPAFNIAARYVFANTGMDTRLKWTHLRTSNSRSVEVTPVQQWISPFSQTGPGTGDTDYDSTGVGKLTKARAKADFHYDAASLDIGTSMQFGSHMKLRLFSGLLCARIKEKIFSIFQHPTPPPIVSLENTSSYLGMGPRFGFLNMYTVYERFTFVGELAAALLFGSLQPAQYLFTGSSASLSDVGIVANKERISSKSVMGVVPSFETKLGFNYEYRFQRCCALSLEAGYMGAIYINALSGYETNENILPVELGSLSTGSMKHVQSNFSVNGPYAMLSMKF